MGERKKIIFIASLPPIQSAICLDGQGDGARIKLDVPRTNIDSVLELQRLSGQSFKVVVVADEFDEFD